MSYMNAYTGVQEKVNLSSRQVSSTKRVNFQEDYQNTMPSIE